MPPNVTLLPLDLDMPYHEVRGAVDWMQRSVTVYGKVHPQPRLTRWYGDVPYVYSGLKWEAQPMPALIQRIRRRVETLAGVPFNSVLCNLYRDGSDCVGWHADDEPIFGGDPVVASVSFGAPRLFKMRRNDKSESRDIRLKNGDLLIMGKGIQPHWKHSLPRTATPCGERINLTFRLTL